MFHSSPLICVALFLLACAAAGCGGSSIDLEHEYSLEESAAMRGPANDVVNLVTNLEAQLRNRESIPKQVLDETAENLANYEPSQFGDKAETFEKIRTEVTSMQSQAENASARAELVERAANLKDMASQLTGAPAE